MRIKLTSWIAAGAVIFFILAICAAVVPGLVKAKQRQQRVQIRLDLQMLTLAAEIYSQENQGFLPDASNWCQELVALTGTNKEPALDPALLNQFLTREQCGYAINSLLAGRKFEVVSSSDIVFFPVNQKGTNLSALPQNEDSFAWDKNGELELVEAGNIVRKLRRVRALSK